METMTSEKIKNMPLDQFMTEAEFLDLCDEDVRAEFVDGRIIVHSPASFQHVRIAAFVTTLVQMFVDKYNLGTVLGDNFQLRIRPGLRRVPDLIFVAAENSVTITQTEIDGAPDLVVEIVSPDSVERDWRDKYFEYEKAKIREYWVIDPSSKRVQIYVLNEKNKFVAQPAEKGVVKSSVLRGFWLKPEWLWQEPLPNVLKVAKELKII